MILLKQFNPINIGYLKQQRLSTITCYVAIGPSIYTRLFEMIEARIVDKYFDKMVNICRFKINVMIDDYRVDGVTIEHLQMSYVQSINTDVLNSMVINFEKQMIYNVKKSFLYQKILPIYYAKVIQQANRNYFESNLNLLLSHYYQYVDNMTSIWRTINT